SSQPAQPRISSCAKAVPAAPCRPKGRAPAKTTQSTRAAAINLLICTTNALTQICTSSAPAGDAASRRDCWTATAWEQLKQRFDFALTVRLVHASVALASRAGLTPSPTDPSRTRWHRNKRDAAFSANEREPRCVTPSSCKHDGGYFHVYDQEIRR